MRTKDNPKRAAVLRRRLHAEIWLDILAKGCGEALKEARYSRYENENMGVVIGHINRELVAAVDEYKAAEEAYEPYWGRRRVRKSKSRNLKRN